MGKAEKGTPKDVANRQKAKGLQKLRWYCQMCQKQCRDENGFKCHTMSESHQRQLLLFADDPDQYLDSFSQEFMEGYTNLLKRRFGTKRVAANNVYQEYIHDRDHVHMNATKWETLTDFVKWLGREGHCVVDETEKGWFVAYVDRDPETLRRQDQLARREKFERDEEERLQDFINRQIEMGKSREGDPDSTNTKYTELKRTDEAETIKLGLVLTKGSSAIKADETRLAKNALMEPASSKSKTSMKPPKSDGKKRSALEEIMDEEKRRRVGSTSVIEDSPKQIPAESPWIIKDIIVKITTKSLGGKYYKQKGFVTSITEDKYVAVVKLLESGTKLKLDQSHLETVVPSLGREVVLLAGEERGEEAVLKSIQEKEYCATVQLSTGKRKGTVLTGIQYEHFNDYVSSYSNDFRQPNQTSRFFTINSDKKTLDLGLSFNVPFLSVPIPSLMTLSETTQALTSMLAVNWPALVFIGVAVIGSAIALPLFAKWLSGTLTGSTGYGTTGPGYGATGPGTGYGTYTGYAGYGRSLEEDPLEGLLPVTPFSSILKQLDDTLAQYDLDSTSCLQRAVCSYLSDSEKSIRDGDAGSSQLIFVGVARSFWLPKLLGNTSVTQALEMGRSGASCPMLYPKCPFSLPGILKFLAAYATMSRRTFSQRND